ncbi:MAG: DUF2306 domain-containing protein [Acidobacteria bacterium]|nr:DUF2306 domain-containing protein [Acidobacteriota bacterium]MDA1236369.1 DUF2306 domain-containing protein [Acidobacteriota bacterium]
MLGTAHVALAIASLTLGAMMFLQQKGGQRHRLLGYLYAGALLLVNSSALLVYEQSPGLGPFHILALVSLATLSGGFIPAFLRQPADSWLDSHAYFMSWSYVGLAAAGAAQMGTMLVGPGVSPVMIPTVLIVVVGALLIHSRVPEILARFAHGKKGEKVEEGRTPT